MLELGNAGSRGRDHRVIASAGTHGDATLDAGAKDGRILNPVALQRGFHRDHSASDVYSYRGGNNGALRGKHRSYRRALAEVAVWHHCHVLVDERHGCRVLDLPERFRLNRVGWQEEHGPVGDSIHPRISAFAYHHKATDFVPRHAAWAPSLLRSAIRAGPGRAVRAG